MDLPVNFEYLTFLFLEFSPRIPDSLGQNLNPLIQTSSDFLLLEAKIRMNNFLLPGFAPRIPDSLGQNLNPPIQTSSDFLLSKVKIRMNSIFTFNNKKEPCRALGGF